MYIMDQQEKVIHNTDFIQRFHIVEKSDAWLIISSIEHDKTPDTLGRYFTEAEAKSVLEQLFKALTNEDKFFEMPRSFNQDTYERKRDARVKRKGGS